MKTLKSTLTNLLYFFVVMIMAQACASPEKLLDNGNYDQVIRIANRKLAGKKHKKAKYVQALEEAFARATQDDMARADRLKAENQEENWGEIVAIYKRVDRRQNQIKPLLPLVDKEGIKANFRFVRTEDLIAEAKNNAAKYHYANAQQLLRDAQNGEKLAAREAYSELEKVESYFRSYGNKEELKRLALKLGKSHILISVENNSQAVLPLALEEEIKRIRVSDMQRRWQEYYTNDRQDVVFDYKIVMNLQAIDIGPSLVREREYEESRQIEDGFDYVLDENGNVKKDTLGNDIKVPHYEQVYAWVLETHQQKVARIAGQLEFYDLRQNSLIESRPLAAENVFENYAATYKGDRRALSKDTKRRIGNAPLPFPTDENMLYEAVTLLKPAMKKEIDRSRRI